MSSSASSTSMVGSTPPQQQSSSSSTSSGSGSMTEHERSFVAKLQKLNSTQQSVQQLALWVMYHQKKCKETAHIWKREILKAPSNRKLAFLFLANDVLQNSRRKTMDFVQRFSEVIPDIIGPVYRSVSEKDRQSITRLFGIWEERQVFPLSIVRSMRKSCSTGFGHNSSNNNNNNYSNSNATDLSHSIISTTPSSSATTGLEDGPASALVRAISAVERAQTETRQDEESHGSSEEIIRQFQRISQQILENESRISSMSLPDLERFQDDLLIHQNALTDMRKSYEHQLDLLNQLLRLLREETTSQENSVRNLDTQIKEWSHRVKIVQNFLTKIEINLNMKRVEDELSRTSSSDSKSLIHHQGSLDGASRPHNSSSSSSSSSSVTAVVAGRLHSDFESTTPPLPDDMGDLDDPIQPIPKKMKPLITHKPTDDIPPPMPAQLLAGAPPPTTDFHSILNALNPTGMAESWIAGTRGGPPDRPVQPPPSGLSFGFPPQPPFLGDDDF